MHRPEYLRALMLGTVAACLTLGGCGSMKPSGGETRSRAKSGATPTEEPAPPAAEPAPSGDGADALPATDDRDHDQEFIASLNTAEVDACQAEGFVYERRKAACSAEIKLASSFACDREGIRAAFAATGFQIDLVLDQALGSASDPNDSGDGYVIDQCGETDGGRRLVYFVKKDSAGKVRVREIETRL